MANRSAKTFRVTHAHRVQCACYGKKMFCRWNVLGHVRSHLGPILGCVGLLSAVLSSRDPVQASVGPESRQKPGSPHMLGGVAQLAFSEGTFLRGRSPESWWFPPLRMAQVYTYTQVVPPGHPFDPGVGLAWAWVLGWLLVAACVLGLWR